MSFSAPRRAQKNAVVKAHQIVWLANHGRIPEGYEVNHRDGRKANNEPSNLELTTRLGNMRHAANQGLLRQPSVLGEKNPRARLSAAQVEEVRRRLAARETHVSIAATLGVARSTISMIAGGRN